MSQGRLNAGQAYSQFRPYPNQMLKISPRLIIEELAFGSVIFVVNESTQTISERRRICFVRKVIMTVNAR